MKTLYDYYKKLYISRFEFEITKKVQQLENIDKKCCPLIHYRKNHAIDSPDHFLYLCTIINFINYFICPVSNFLAPKSAKN